MNVAIFFFLEHNDCCALDWHFLLLVLISYGLTAKKKKKKGANDNHLM